MAAGLTRHATAARLRPGRDRALQCGSAVLDLSRRHRGPARPLERYRSVLAYLAAPSARLPRTGHLLPPEHHRVQRDRHGNALQQTNNRVTAAAGPR